jgi:hypothetical protein
MLCFEGGGLLIMLMVVDSETWLVKNLKVPTPGTGVSFDRTGPNLHMKPEEFGTTLLFSDMVILQLPLGWWHGAQ